MLNSSNMAGFFTKSISHLIGSNYYNSRNTEETSPYILGTSPPDSSMELYILDNKLQVCSCPKEKINEFCYPLLKIALLPDSRPNFFSITETPDEYTLIVTEEDYLEFTAHTKLQTSGQPWRALTVSIGALGTFNELVGVTKIAKSAIGPLADNDISVLCLSTYQSDYILIQDSDLEKAVQCLSGHFKIFNEDHKRVNECKLSTSPASPVPSDTRPIIHPYNSPLDDYYVTGLDESKLPAVTQVLLELIFFSGSSENDNKPFFHLTMVRGDISLVLNEFAFKKFPSNVLYTRKNEKWRIIGIGEGHLGFEECGIVAQIVEPLASAQLSTYYISSFAIEYCMVLEKDCRTALDIFEKLKKFNLDALITESLSITDGNPLEVDENLDVPLQEPCKEMRPGENMSLGQSLQSLEEENGNHYRLSVGYSRSPQTPVSECSSYGTSPSSDPEVQSSDSTVHQNNDAVLSEPIPIPGNSCLHDSLSRLKC